MIPCRLPGAEEWEVQKARQEEEALGSFSVFLESFWVSSLWDDWAI